MKQGPTMTVLHFFLILNKIKLFYKADQNGPRSKPVNISLKSNILWGLSFGSYKDIYKLFRF